MEGNLRSGVDALGDVVGSPNMTLPQPMSSNRIAQHHLLGDINNRGDRIRFAGIISFEDLFKFPAAFGSKIYPVIVCARSGSVQRFLRSFEVGMVGFGQSAFFQEVALLSTSDSLNDNILFYAECTGFWKHRIIPLVQLGC